MLTSPAQNLNSSSAPHTSLKREKMRGDVCSSPSLLTDVTTGKSREPTGWCAVCWSFWSCRSPVCRGFSEDTSIIPSQITQGLRRSGQASQPALDFSGPLIPALLSSQRTSQQGLSLARAIPAFQRKLGSYLRHPRERLVFERSVEVSESGEG